MSKKPREIVEELNKHIIGQNEAKRAVAVALRNRHRRKYIEELLRNEITPKNILMIGSTGVGKTEIARRLAKLEKAPFIKIEATKFTEIGYVGRDVESIIRDLLDISIKLVKEEFSSKFCKKAEDEARKKIIEILLNDDKNNYFDDERKEKKRKILEEEILEESMLEKEIEIEIINKKNIEFVSIPGMENITNQFNNLLEIIPNSKKKQKVTIRDAIKIIKEEELEKLENKEEIKQESIKRMEENGIVFIDEIDKITQSSERKNYSDVSREGVQRDLLPLLDGSNVMTKFGIVKTNHILFIAAGAFHVTKPSDLIPELQGRLPIRVNLNSLNKDDFVKILLETDYSLIKQYKDLLKIDNVNLIFSEESIDLIASIAHKTNQIIENIGARRLYTIMEKLLEEILFNAGDSIKGDFIINNDYVNKKLKNIYHANNLNKFIL